MIQRVALSEYEQPRLKTGGGMIQNMKKICWIQGGTMFRILSSHFHDLRRSINSASVAWHLD